MAMDRKIGKNLYLSVVSSPDDKAETGKGFWGSLYDEKGRDVGEPTQLCSTVAEVVEVAKEMARRIS